MSIEITATPDLAGATTDNTPDNPVTREACKEFEGLLISMIMKNGMKATVDDADDHGGEVMKEYAVEQAARQLGSLGAFGISDMLYQQLTQAGSRQ